MTCKDCKEYNHCKPVDTLICCWFTFKNDKDEVNE